MKDATWVNIDVDTLNSEQRHAWDTYKAQYRAMKSAREMFEAIMANGVQPGSRMIFGYNFGKLSVAIVDDDRKQAKPKQVKLTLAQFLASQASSGHAH